MRPRHAGHPPRLGPCSDAGSARSHGRLRAQEPLWPSAVPLGHRHPEAGAGGELGAAAGVYPGDRSGRNVALAGRDGRGDTAPCPCRRRVSQLQSGLS